ncbi:hypothetical protein QZH41_012432 [Actinostola sp. cb2023]|nr:hypothetical protein QZH41_012432 [Actinostola sp. cb2023]
MATSMHDLKYQEENQRNAFSSLSKRSKTRDEIQRKEKVSVLAAFFAWGGIFYMFESAALSGAQDILAGATLQTSTVYIAFIASVTFTNVAAPHLVIRVPFSWSISWAVLLQMGGLLVVPFVGNVYWKLLGVVVMGFGTGYGQTVLLALTSFFDSEKAVSSYAAGTGFGFMLSLLYYTALTTWFCVSSSIAFVLLAPFSLLSFVCYYVITKNCLTNATTSIHKTVEYRSLQNSDAEDTEETANSDDLTTKEKISTIVNLFASVAVPLFTAYFSEYTILQSVITSLGYQNAPFRPRDHYQYYFIVLWSGELIGRSHRTVLSLINSRWLYNITVKGLWALALVEILHLLILFCESWYRFLPGVEIVLCICFTAGLIVGSLFNNAGELFSGLLEERQRKFGIGFYSFPLNFGILTAGFMGLALEPQLRQHCTALVTDSAFCTTRAKSFQDIALGCASKSVQL